ncbi:MAG: rRNA maturation RNase YbeY [Spirochaetales bacterium]|nr:rRNA maturation RNase YbeY [Spirochaetales bacterium]
MSETGSEFVVTVAFPPLPWKKNYEDYVLKVLKLLGVRTWDLGVRLTDDEELRMLNRDFRGKDEPTDVLSFESEPFQGSDPKENPKIAGDLAISLAMVQTNARYFGVSEEEEMKRVTLHGILHLQGWDHKSNDTSEPMLVHQENLLAQLTEVKLF